MLLLLHSLLIGCACVHAGIMLQVPGDDHEIESAVLQIIETVDVPAKTVGPLLALHAKQGDLISTADVLAQIDDGEAQIQLKEAKIELDIIREQVESNVDIEFAIKSKAVTTADWRRAQDSNRQYSGVVSDREMDRLKLLVEQSDAELEKIKFDKKLLRLQLQLKQAIVEKRELAVERHKVRSAISGQVTEVQKFTGEWVNIAEPVFKIVRLDRLRIEEYLPVNIAKSSLVGASATFSIGPRKLNGEVVFVSPRIDPINSTVLVRLEFQNPGLDFRPGTEGSVVVRTSQSTENSD